MRFFPQVSIITPSYNSAQYIERTIKSVACQDYPSIEHIVIDGGSSDGTIEILRRFPNISWVSEPDKGQSHAINKGFAMAKGEILAWINADDTYNPGAISVAVAELMENPDIGLVHSDYNIVNENDVVIERIHSAHFEADQLFLSNEIPGQCTAFWRREVFEQVGGLDENLHYGMDYEFWLRVVLVFGIRHIPSLYLANFRLCPGTKTTSHAEAFPLEFDRALIKVLDSPGLLSLPGSLRNRVTASALRHRACIACFRNQPSQGAALFREASRMNASLRDRDILMIKRHLAHCVRSPWVENPTDMLQILFADDLPTEIRQIEDRILGHAHYVYAITFFERGDFLSTRRHIVKSYRYCPELLLDRGLRSILAQTVLGTKLASKFRRCLIKLGLRSIQ